MDENICIIDAYLAGTMKLAYEAKAGYSGCGQGRGGPRGPLSLAALDDLL